MHLEVGPGLGGGEGTNGRGDPLCKYNNYNQDLVRHVSGGGGRGDRMRQVFIGFTLSI